MEGLEEFSEVGASSYQMVVLISAQVFHGGARPSSAIISLNKFEKRFYIPSCDATQSSLFKPLSPIFVSHGPIIRKYLLIGTSRKKNYIRAKRNASEKISG